MWNNLILTALTCCIFSAPLQAAELTLVAQETPTQEIVTVTGAVFDALTGLPLEGVYIKQQDSLNAVFSQSAGQFELRLMRGFPEILVFSREGYEPVALPFQRATSQMQIRLQPLGVYRPTTAPAHSTSLMPRPSRVFGDQFSFFYQLNYALLQDSNVGVQGAALNEMGLDTELLLFYPLALRGRFYRGRLPVDVAGFPFQPAFFVNTLQARLGAGWIQDFKPGMQFYLGGDLLFHNQSPDNRSAQDQLPVPFTGSILDFEQNRFSLGARAALGWQVNERLSFFPEIALYPVGINFVRNRVLSPADFLMAGDLGIKGRFEIIPGVYAVANYNTQLWYGFGANYLNNMHFFHLGVSVDPWTVAAQLK
jgi:hypothetical protein